MTITKDQKQEIVATYRRHTTDTSSPEVQVAMLTRRILDLNDHFKTHEKDHHSRRGLLHIVGQRKRILEYLKQKDIERYRKLIGQLGLRK